MEQILQGAHEGAVGVATREEVDTLNKALTAGYGYTGVSSSFAGGAPLMVESLEASLKSTTWQMKNLILWPVLPVDKAYNTVEQYSRITSYGGNGSPYFNEGGSPREEDAVYNRAVQKIVYFGTRRRVSHPMMLVRVAFGDAVAREINNGNMWLLQNIERELYLGNSMFSNAGLFDGAASAIHTDSLALMGIDQQVRSGDADAMVQAVAFSGFGGAQSVVKSLEDAVLSPDDLEDGAVSILQNFGVPMALHLEPIALSDLSRQYFVKERINPMGVVNGVAGFVLQKFTSSAGVFDLRPNIFLRPKREFFAAPTASAAPAVPVVASAAPAGVAAGTTFAIGEVYTYKAAACNEQGESAASASVAAAAIAVAADSIVVTITNVVGAKYYAVYRTEAGAAAGTEKFIGYVKAAAGASTVLTDLNKKLPGRSEAFLMFLDPEAIMFKQLSPLAKINLATVAASFEWLQVLYGCLILATPRKHFIYENIGRTI